MQRAEYEGMHFMQALTCRVSCHFIFSHSTALPYSASSNAPWVIQWFFFFPFKQRRSIENAFSKIQTLAHDDCIIVYVALAPCNCLWKCVFYQGRWHVLHAEERMFNPLHLSHTSRLTINYLSQDAAKLYSLTYWTSNEKNIMLYKYVTCFFAIEILSFCCLTLKSETVFITNAQEMKLTNL